MSLRDTTAPSQGNAISFEFHLPHPPANVWRALTDPELLSQWLLPSAGFELAPNTRFTFSAPPQPGWDGVVHCQIIGIEADRMIRYAWRVGDIDTVVTFTLLPTESGTHLSLVQSGFKPEQKHNFGGARYGWGMMGNRLVELLARTS